MAWLLQQDEELQGVLSDALMRSEQHRENYLRFLGFNFDPNSNSLGRLKSQLEVALHQHKALEGELERSRVEAEDQVMMAIVMAMMTILMEMMPPNKLCALAQCD